MARLNVNPTRMVLTSLKKRLKVAVKGHKMLKDKRDELMKQFLELARENKSLREQVESYLNNVYSNFVIASAVMS
ncbi:MAG TPA: V-type ATP synthase subunit D, partial [Clostridiales bacterium]|nr:V-type ATP synthase subunit D [Clostridiales bacterium]